MEVYGIYADLKCHGYIVFRRDIRLVDSFSMANVTIGIH